VELAARPRARALFLSNACLNRPRSRQIVRRHMPRILLRRRACLESRPMEESPQDPIERATSNREGLRPPPLPQAEFRDHHPLASADRSAVHGAGEYGFGVPAIRPRFEAIDGWPARRFCCTRARRATRSSIEDVPHLRRADRKSSSQSALLIVTRLRQGG